MDKLELHLESLDGVPEAVQGFYEDTGDGFKLKLATDVVAKAEADKHKSKVDEFRTSNIKLLEENKQLKSLPRTDADVESLVVNRIKEKMSEFETEKQTLTEQINTYKSNYHNTLLDNAITEAATKNHVRSAAITDVQLRAKTMFAVDEDGKIVAKDREGNVKMDKDGVTPLSVNSWLSRMTNDASHWFEQSRGTGATGNNGRVSANAPKSTLDIYTQHLSKSK